MSRNGHIPQTALAPRKALQPAAPERFFWPADDVRETDGSGHIHWGITAFVAWVDGNMADALTIEVEAVDEESAIARAMTLVQRPLYRVSWVKESCSQELAKKE